MRRFRISIAYATKHLASIDFELGPDELDPSYAAVLRVSQDYLDVFAALGLPEPQPMPVMLTELQVAQKLHACTVVGAVRANARAQDLVDLQFFDRAERIDPVVTCLIAERLFVCRNAQSWPPVIVVRAR